MQFLQRIFLTSENLAIFGVNVTSCEFDQTVDTWVTGAIIEGLSVLANVTANATWSNTMAEVISAAVQPDENWNSEFGAINEGAY
jgi:hypothetical protein